MDGMRCVRSLMDLQAQLQRAIELQEEIQTEVLAHLLLPQSTRRLTIPEGFGASEDVEAYFATFERAATALKLPQKKWRTQVMTLLGMDHSEGQDSSLQDHGYEDVKDHFHMQASVAEQQWQVNFTLANFDPMKGPRELGQGLDEAARRWLKPERRSAEDVVRRVALQKFVSLLPRAMSDWVVQQQSKDMEAAISLAEQFLESRNNEEYGEREDDTAGQQYTATDLSDKSGASNQLRVTTANAMKPWTTAPKEEETSLSVSFNVEVEGLGEIDLKGEGGEEQEEPVEEEDDMCSGEIVIESSSDIGQPSVTTTRRQPVRKAATRVKKISFGANEATLTKSHACSDCGRGFTRLFHLRRHKCGSALLASQKCEIVTTANAQEGKEPKPWTTAPKEEETSLKLCQSVSFNVEVEGLGEINLKGEGGEEQEEHPPHIEQMPVEEEDDMCSGEIVMESASDIGQPSVTTTRRQPVRKATTRVKKISFGANEATLTKSHACSDCGKSFTRLFHLRRHKCGSALLAGQKCESTSASHTQLPQRRRSRGKLHSCPYCVRQFHKKCNLESHVHTHTGERPHQCPDCGAAFAQRHGMLEHRNIHTGQRPFVCHECGRGFRHSSNLSKHCKLHSDLRPFLCTVCGKTFKIKEGLRAHLLVHAKNTEKNECMLK